MRIIVTGASGFVGSHLCRALHGSGTKVLACLMTADEHKTISADIPYFVAGSIDGQTAWGEILRKDDVIVHLAARVHVMRESAREPLSEFRKVNRDGTANLARQAAAAGAKRIVFMSTIGVNGNDSGAGLFTENDIARPHNDYSVSKYEAELELRKISEETGLEVVVLRAPLVYGPGNPGNFLSLLGFVHKGIPLPLGSVRNVKSFLYVENLVEAIRLCCSHPGAAGNTYLVSDSDVISTPELLRKLGESLGVKSRLFPFPMTLLRIIGKVSGKSAALDRLTASLAVDSSKIRKGLGWTPPFSLSEGLKATTEWYKDL